MSQNIATVSTIRNLWEIAPMSVEHVCRLIFGNTDAPVEHLISKWKGYSACGLCDTKGTLRFYTDLDYGNAAIFNAWIETPNQQYR